MLFAVLGGFIWGLMEGLWFFIIPDIFLSYIAIKGFKRALAATASAVVGSMVAAGLLYGLKSSGLLENLRQFWIHLPGYYPKMFDVAQRHLGEFHGQGLLQGPQSGIPYRFYVFEAALSNISLSDILFWTPAARLERILLAPMVVLGLRFVLNKLRSKFPRIKTNLILYVGITLYWIGIYVWYWGSFLPKTYGGA
ncbi:MAG: hypothetical protein ACM3MG_07370 [Bacillota bacterium]